MQYIYFYKKKFRGDWIQTQLNPAGEWYLLSGLIPLSFTEIWVRCQFWPQARISMAAAVGLGWGQSHMIYLPLEYFLKENILSRWKQVRSNSCLSQGPLKMLFERGFPLLKTSLKVPEKTIPETWLHFSGSSFLSSASVPISPSLLGPQLISLKRRMG